MSAAKKDIFKLSNGDILVSVHDETSIHIRSITREGDPVELNEEEARELAALLLSLANRVE